jgi:hypothetical protein
VFELSGRNRIEAHRVPIVQRFELVTVNRDTGISEQVQLLTQHHELAIDSPDRFPGCFQVYR